MVESIKELEAQHRERMQQATQGFATFCKSLQINETSQAQLLGVSRQTWVNYKNAKTTPTPAFAARMKIVLPLLRQAKEQGLLPIDGRHKQGGVVKQILSLQ